MRADSLRTPGPARLNHTFVNKILQRGRHFLKMCHHMYKTTVDLINIVLFLLVDDLSVLICIFVKFLGGPMNACTCVPGCCQCTFASNRVLFHSRTGGLNITRHHNDF